MNTEYTVSTSNDAFNKITSFILLNGFNVVISGTLGICQFNSGYIYIYDDGSSLHFTASSSFNSSLPLYDQERMPRKGGNSAVVYCTTLNVLGTSLWCNYNSDTFMFSSINTSDIIRKTSSAGFGILTKLFNTWDGGTFIFGTSASTLKESSSGGMEFSSVGSDSMFAALQVEDDAASTNMRSNNYWATNIGGSNPLTEVPLVVSLVGANSAKIPTYADFFFTGKGGILYRGQSNQMNCITLCMPLIFYVMRDPHILETYSCAGMTDIINSCSMYNLSSGRMIQSDYPVESNNYQCFCVNKRRGGNIGGYAGIAFRQEAN